MLVAAAVLYLFGLLVIAGGSKLVKPQATAKALQSMAPEWARRFLQGPSGTVARIIGAWEASLGILQLVFVSGLLGTIFSVCTLATTISFPLVILRARAVGSGCGCTAGSRQPPNRLAIFRSLSIAGVATFSLSKLDHPLTPTLGSYVLAGLALIVTLVSMTAPSPMPHRLPAAPVATQGGLATPLSRRSVLKGIASLGVVAQGLALRPLRVLGALLPAPAPALRYSHPTAAVAQSRIAQMLNDSAFERLIAELDGMAIDPTTFRAVDFSLGDWSRELVTVRIPGRGVLGWCTELLPRTGRSFSTAVFTERQPDGAFPPYRTALMVYATNGRTAVKSQPATTGADCCFTLAYGACAAADCCQTYYCECQAVPGLDTCLGGPDCSGNPLGQLCCEECTGTAGISCAITCGGCLKCCCDNRGEGCPCQGAPCGQDPCCLTCEHDCNDPSCDASTQFWMNGCCNPCTKLQC